jgi:hypothetical protein
MALPTQDPLQLLPSSIQLLQLIRQRKQHQRMHLNASWMATKQLEGRCLEFSKRIQGYLRFLQLNLGIPGNDSFLKEIAEDKVRWRTPERMQLHHACTDRCTGAVL